MDDLISRQDAMDALMPIYKSASLRNRNVFSTARKCMAAIEELPSAQPDCSDCIKHGGDWDCDHVHCHKGEAAQPDNDMIHLQKEQAYLQGWEEGRKALRKEIWEDGRDRLD